MDDSLKAKARAREAYKKWWKANRAVLNARRAARYHGDAEYRKSAIERQSRYRKASTARPSDGVKTRVVNGVRLRVFSISQTSDLVGRSVQTLRLWQSKGWIPEHTMGGVQRFYSDAQVQLMIELAGVLDLHYPTKAERMQAVEEKVKDVATRWKGK